jgi:CubicO group peptidase (beta-lactamase class C family)
LGALRNGSNLLCFIITCVLGLVGFSCDYQTKSTDIYENSLGSEISLIIDEWRDHEKATGALVSVYSEKLGLRDFVSGYSTITRYPDKYPNKSIDTNRPLPIGDVGHIFLGARIVQLISKGDLNLDDRLIKWFPDVNNSESITVQDLLYHSSGIPVFYQSEKLNTFLVNDELDIFEPDKIIKMADQEGTYFEPGQEYGYSKTNYIILGRIIENITGNNIETDLEENIFQKLHLTQTFFGFSENNPDGMPVGYEFVGDFTNNPNVIDGHVPHMITDEQVSVEWASGGIFSTTPDLIKSVRTLHNGFFSEKEYAIFNKLGNKVANEDGAKEIQVTPGMFRWLDDYGVVIGQFGFLYPFSAQVIYWPDTDVAISVIINEVDASINPNSNFQLPVIDSLVNKLSPLLHE